MIEVHGIGRADAAPDALPEGAGLLARGEFGQVGGGGRLDFGIGVEGERALIGRRSRGGRVLDMFHLVG